MQSELVKDELLRKAISGLLLRSERQDDAQKLVGTFVDVGVLPQLESRNSEIVYGRRGTGKTHVLRVLKTKLEGEARVGVCFIDGRTLGSTAQFSDTALSVSVRCLALFRDVLGEMYSTLLELVVESDAAQGDGALEILAQVEAAITPQRAAYETSREVREQDKSGKGRSSSFDLTSEGAKLSMAGSKTKESTLESTTAYKVELQDKVLFPELHHALKRLLEKLDATLYVLFDEWSSIPRDLQPYLAEFLKRGVLPVNRVTLKIAALEYRSTFSSRREDGSLLGFELGSDISAGLDLDEYYVFDKNPDQATQTYADVLLRHIEIELPERYLETHYAVRSGLDLASRLFTERDTFVELARASEGVIRDLINIFLRAFFDSNKRGRGSIDRKSVLEAARLWFEQDKAKALTDDLHKVLARIVDEVIGKRQARSFLLPRDLEQHPTIQRLFDARVVHQMQRGYADKDNPGVRYNIYTLDYGTYVDLLSTIKAPTGLQEMGDQAGDFVVPFDDKRSIRRIILEPQILEI